MKISFNLLQRFIHLDQTPEEVADILTSIGLEVEGIERYESVKGGLKGLVVGQVKEVWKHPNADKLNCTKVDVGTGTDLPIVCGAPNVAAGQKVVVATVGTMLYPSEGDQFEIKKAKIRGEVSEGMICAEDEIGLGQSHDGILVLSENTKIGTPAAELFEVNTDFVFEIGLTPNRADAASHYGVARDLKAAIAHRKGSNIELCKPAIDKFQPQNNTLEIPVIVENSEACPRYVGVTVSGIEVKDSPKWLQNTLRAIGVRPINNVVDVTNYINHAFGQPLHAFDVDEISGNQVVVKTLPAKSKFTTLDEEERELHEEDLMICNAQDGMCIAGVFGGIKSGVTSSTTKVFIESAYFNPVWVRKTAKRHGLNTDASFRFERGIDPNQTDYAAKLAALMIVEMAGGQISSALSDTHPDPFPAFEVNYRTDKADALIGIEIPPKTTESILEALEINISSKKGTTWSLEVPPFKVDVTREADVIEEVLRIYGYDRVPVSRKVLSTIKDMKPGDQTLAKGAITALLVSNGFLECMSNSMTDEKYAALSNEWAVEDIVQLNNPLSSELGIMRPAMLFSSLQNAAYNLNRQQPNLKLFEFGNIYRTSKSGYFEEERLGVLVCGRAISDHWRVADLNADWYELKGALELILQKLGVDSSQLASTETKNDWFEFGMDWSVQGKTIISAGLISASLKKVFDIKKDVFYLELKWAPLVAMRKRVIKIGQLPKYPEVRRDLALLLDDSVAYSTLEKLAFQTEKRLLKSVQLFDVFQGKGLPTGKKSYALTFNLRDDEKTLTDQEVERTMNGLLDCFKREVGAELRG